MADADYTKLATGLKSRNYYGTLAEIRDALSLPTSTKHSEMEALLIFVINDLYNDKIQTDITLMAVGLLNGFSRSQGRAEPKDESKLYSKRREQFLKETNYIEVVSEGRFRSYDEAQNAQKGTSEDGKIKTELDTIRGTLGKDDTRYLADAISTLYARKERIGDYLTAAKDAFTEKASQKGVHKINWRNWNRIPQDWLPTLKHLKRIKQTPRESLSPTPEINSRSQDLEGGGEKIVTPSSENDYKMKLIIAICRYVFAFVIVVAATILIFTKTLAENRGQFETHTSNCSFRLDFRPDDYDRPPPSLSDDILWDEDIRNSQD